MVNIKWNKISTTNMTNLELCYIANWKVGKQEGGQTGRMDEGRNTYIMKRDDCLASIIISKAALIIFC